jgi:mono/diheme cytochrome c family protein
MKRGLELFVTKCSTCHNIARALSVVKDQEVWEQTIRRMQHYSKGMITDAEVMELVNFHVDRQQKEIDTFQETCTSCHDDERINSRSMSEEQWLATIRRMQQKAPELITDEKVNLLAAYFHRRELTMARIFAGRCRLCHLAGAGQDPPPVSLRQLDGLVAMANREFGQNLQIKDVNNLQSVHVQRQQRSMELFKQDCAACHAGDRPPEQAGRGEAAAKRTRAEWISFIAALRGVELSKETQNSIDSQIDFHKSRH